MILITFAAFGTLISALTVGAIRTLMAKRYGWAASFAAIAVAGCFAAPAMNSLHGLAPLEAMEFIETDTGFYNPDIGLLVSASGMTLDSGREVKQIPDAYVSISPYFSLKFDKITTLLAAIGTGIMVGVSITPMNIRSIVTMFASGIIVTGALGSMMAGIYHDRIPTVDQWVKINDNRYEALGGRAVMTRNGVSVDGKPLIGSHNAIFQYETPPKPPKTEAVDIADLIA